MAKRSKGERQTNRAATDTPGGGADLEPDVAEVAASEQLQAASTREFAAVAPDAHEPDALPSDTSTSFDADVDEDAGATREAAIVAATPTFPATAGPNETIILAPAAEHVAESSAPETPPATVSPAQHTKPAESSPSQDTPTPGRRFNTLAGAFSRPRLDTPPVEFEATPSFLTDDDTSGVADEVDPEVEWSVADQPTVQLTQEELRQLRPSSFLDTGEQESWPPRPNTPPPAARTPPLPAHPVAPPSQPVRPEETRERFDWRSSLPPRPQPPFPLSNLGSPLAHTERLAAPDGRPAQGPEADGPAPDFRMERFQELRRHRVAHEHGDPATDDVTPVADAVRQWWHDLRPGVGGALKFQREARESGTHPLPAYAAPTTTSRLGDAFGRLAATARGMTERAQQAAGAIHDHVEHAAQGLIQVFEGDAARQQAPLLGPGRIAIFFRKGVSVGQAQRLLAASSARPMRLIPRKHGILAQVMPGLESEVGERLRKHPYVDDVAYMDYDEHGERRGGR